jgi:hypothetical protein
MTTTVANERGMALALALFALIILGALVAAVFPLATLEQRSGTGALYLIEADLAAEAGPVAVLARWTSDRFDTLPVNGSAVVGPVAVGGRLASRWVATISRLNGELFLVRSVGRRLDAAGGELARREVAVVLRLSPDTSSAGAGSTGAILAPASASEPDPGVVGLPRLRRPPPAAGAWSAEPLRYRSWARVD